LDFRHFLRLSSGDFEPLDVLDGFYFAECLHGCQKTLL